jgi:hypothetical protein
MGKITEKDTKIVLSDRSSIQKSKTIGGDAYAV